MTKYVFDIDGTICISLEGLYQDAVPLRERILIINKLFTEGNEIILYTARGMGSSGNNEIIAKEKWEELTINQLKTWGVKFHKLYFGKPSGDIYVDDKGISDLDFFKQSC